MMTKICRKVITLLYHYKNQSCPQAAQLLKEDIINYSVLRRILQEQCAHIFTDMEKFIVCHSNWPYPVWVWCRDAEDENSVLEIARSIREDFPLEQGYVHTMSHTLLKILREKDEYFRDANEKMGLLSYRLDVINDIDYSCEGYVSKVQESEIDSLIDVWHDMHMEMEEHDLSAEHCQKSMFKLVSAGRLFAWRLEDGTITALTGRGDQAPYSKITSVYTLPEYRRRGYAINLVHKVTESMLADGFVPILYTNADYIASNACYRKIGYRQVGGLTSIGK